MKRRSFVQSTGVAAAAVAGSLLGHAARAATGQKVIVIGAGMAGIAAAKTLRDKGHAVTLLEAQNRIGGRIHTSFDWPDCPIDLGASWIHESSGNPLTPIAQACGARMITTDYASFVTYDPLLGKIPTGAGSAYSKMQTKVDNAIQAGYDTNTDQPLRAVIESQLGFNSLSDSNKRLANHFVVSKADDEYAGDSAELSSWWWDAMGGYSGLDAVLPDGYIALVNYLAQGLDIRLNQQVTKVSYTSSSVSVTTGQGVYTGDRVVVAVPLGVLKKNLITFSPALPAKKNTAISKLGMGTGVLSKLFLRFPSVFWDDVDWIEHVASVPRRGQFHQWLNCARVTGGQPVLLGFLGGFYGHDEEVNLTDAQIVADAMAALREMYGPRIPDPIDWQIPRWGTDPYTYGSYSFHKVGSTPTMRTDLAASINKRVFFAGEATHKDMFATVHGAYLSGLAAAAAIQAA